MACTDSLRGDPTPRLSFVPPVPRSWPLRRRVGAALQKAWRNYWRRRAAWATCTMLRSLDDRALKDIGIDRSEIESVVYAGSDRRIRLARWR
jgi:uncharacterized protein YjiS (DUF1127 family)